MTMHDAATTGDRTAALVALRDALAAAIDRAEPRELAPLARQMQAVLAELEQLLVPAEGSVSDELRARRAARLAAADVRDEAAGDR